MALDRYKTQVLLLHSEQSTLDKFSTGFDDRYTVHCATSGSEALTTLGETPIHVIVSAQKLPGMSGAELCERIVANRPDVPVVVMTAWGSVEVAVEAMRRGARDFVQKPWENDRLLTILRTQVELARALRRGRRAGRRGGRWSHRDRVAFRRWSARR